MNARAWTPFAATLALALVAACGPVPPAATPGPVTATAPADDPTGTYSFSSEALDQRFDGEITLTRGADGSIGGRVTTPLTGPLPVTSVTARNQEMRITAQGPEGQATIELEFAGSNFVGGWLYAGGGGLLHGIQASGPALAVRADLPAAGEPGVDYTGSYTIPGPNLRVDFRRDGTHLVSQAQGQAGFPLLYLGMHRFRSPSALGIEVQFNVEGNRARSFTLRQGDVVIEAPRSQ